LPGPAVFEPAQNQITTAITTAIIPNDRRGNVAADDKKEFENPAPTTTHQACFDVISVLTVSFGSKAQRLRAFAWHATGNYLMSVFGLFLQLYLPGRS